MEFTFVCMGKKSVSVESVEYFPDMGFVLRNIIRVDEDVIKIDDDNDINHIVMYFFRLRKNQQNGENQ